MLIRNLGCIKVIVELYNTVEPPHLERLPRWSQKYDLSRQVVSGDIYYIGMRVMPKLCGLSRQVVSHGSGL